MGKHHLRLDLGIRDLLPEWRKLVSPFGLRDDLIAGATTACIALPLSLAIALASGVHPSVGLVTAIVAGIVCALFGGTTLAVSGPAAAMAVLIAAIEQQYGMSSLLVVGLLCGLWQMLTGILGLGKLVRYVPAPVISGFTAGVGAIILIGQLPRALGLEPPDQSHVVDVIVHIAELIHTTNLAALVLALATVGITLVLPLFLPRLPAPLVAVVLPSIAATMFHLPVKLIGDIPSTLPSPALPGWPSANVGALVTASFIVYALASLETLLSSSAVDKLAKGHRHDPDQELVGQGLGNIASALFGGIPVTGVIARSALNVQAGAKTRRASLFHSLLLLATVYVLGTIIERIPTPVLAGMLLAVALRMLHPRELMHLWRWSRIEALTYAVTFFTIVFVDLIVGVQAGVAAALAIAAFRLGRTHAKIHTFKADSPTLLHIDGPLTFLASARIDDIRNQLTHADLSKGLIIDLSHLLAIDTSGAAQLKEMLTSLHDRRVRVALQGVTAECRRILLEEDEDGIIAQMCAQTEPEAHRKVHGSASGADHLVHGVHKFRSTNWRSDTGLFKRLAEGQSPHTLFITCSDSRIDPNLITSTLPGELFIVRNVGNVIPVSGNDETPAEGAAVEFAIGILGITDIVVCGHSGCGAMKAVLSGDFLLPSEQARFPNLSKWLNQSTGLKEQLTGVKTSLKADNAAIEIAAATNAVLQLANLRTYSLIQAGLDNGSLRLHAWYYDIGDARLLAWDQDSEQFVELGSKAIRAVEKRIESGLQFQAPVAARTAPTHDILGRKVL